MFKLLTTFIFSMSMLWTLICFGQWQTYAPLGTLPMQYNSSFAGQVGGPRFTSNSMYWQHKSDAYKYQGTYSRLSYDQFIPAMRTGIGITVGYSAFSTDLYYNGHNSFTNPSVSVAIAPKISISGKYTISSSIDFSFDVSEINFTINRLPDTLLYSHRKQYGINSRVGLLVNTNKFYLGYTVNIVRQPIYTSLIRHLKGDFESYLQAGYTFQREPESDFSFTPQVVIKLAKYTRENRMYSGIEAYNLNFRYKQFIWGMNDGGFPSITPLQDKKLREKVAIHLGWQTGRVRIMLSNSYNPRHKGFTYNGNLSLRYIFTDKTQKARRPW
jgi:hypothetical protein